VTAQRCKRPASKAARSPGQLSLTSLMDTFSDAIHPNPRAPFLDLVDDELAEMVVDSFAGGGGASLGIEMALGRSPDIAINHDPEAIAMHRANHPGTRHYLENVWRVKPVEACAGRRVGLAWFSPDCKHHSKAKGAKPRNQKIRGLAWVVIRWAASEVRPRVIVVENVEEFQTWGPLLPNGKPCPARKGKTFRAWRRKLERLGYVVEHRELRACDYGAPTTRKRLFVIARCDGRPIVWPAPTHGPGRAQSYRTAAECIDWSRPCPSIFLTAEEGQALGVRRPLAEKTMARIARGLARHVFGNARPFIVPTNHGGVGRNDLRVHDVDGPLPTITAAHRGELALVAPTLIQTGYGERPGQAPRALDLHAPLGTVMAGGSKHAVVAAFLAKHYGGHEGSGSSLQNSFDAVTCRDHHALVTSNLVKFRGTSDAHIAASSQPVTEPMPTISAQGWHVGEVRAFLVKYYSAQGTGQSLFDPLHTVTSRDTFGLVTVEGEDYQLVDIGMRMLNARELFRAQGFPDSYVIDPAVNGKPLSGTAQIKMCGNSVCPDLAAAIVRANCTALAKSRAREAVFA
jgi:DNA (cytosine-5)-methyltransferase 1